jgi:hypothetical protein
MAAAACPGIYCGRLDSTAPCAACPAGTRVNPISALCEPCAESPAAYDWIYLVLMALPVLACIIVALARYFVSFPTLPTRSRAVIFAAAIAECAIAFLLALLAFPPRGELALLVCPPRSLSDWYTALANPVVRYTQHYNCAQQAVYPLCVPLVVPVGCLLCVSLSGPARYSFVFLFYLLWLLLFLVGQTQLNRYYCLPRPWKMLYAPLLAFPFATLLHAAGAGVLCACTSPSLCGVYALLRILVQTFHSPTPRWLLACSWGWLWLPCLSPIP